MIEPRERHPVRRVVQKDRDGCGVACVAMLAGVTYKRAKDVMFGNDSVSLTSTADLYNALKIFRKRPLGKRLIPLRTRSYRDLDANALLKIARPGKSWWHWIVWDARRKEFLDPDTPSLRRHRVISYLLVR